VAALRGARGGVVAPCRRLTRRAAARGRARRGGASDCRSTSGDCRGYGERRQEWLESMGHWIHLLCRLPSEKDPDRPCEPRRSQIRISGGSAGGAPPRERGRDAGARQARRGGPAGTLGPGRRAAGARPGRWGPARGPGPAGAPPDRPRVTGTAVRTTRQNAHFRARDDLRQGGSSRMRGFRTLWATPGQNPRRAL
jgi:hypothetical protein